jgi:hypothetical protein
MVLFIFLKIKAKPNGSYVIHEKFKFHDFKNASYCFDKSTNYHFYFFGVKNGKLTSQVSYTKVEFEKNGSVKNRKLTSQVSYTKVEFEKNGKNRYCLKNPNSFEIDIPKRQGTFNIK